jgi:hypothetical protein
MRWRIDPDQTAAAESLLQRIRAPLPESSRENMTEITASRIGPLRLICIKKTAQASR